MYSQRSLLQKDCRQNKPHMLGDEVPATTGMTATAGFATVIASGMAENAKPLKTQNPKPSTLNNPEALVP